MCILGSFHHRQLKCINLRAHKVHTALHLSWDVSMYSLEIVTHEHGGVCCCGDLISESTKRKSCVAPLPQQLSIMTLLLSKPSFHGKKELLHV